MDNFMIIRDWYCQPIHCPFCGAPLSLDEQTGCKHLLCIIFPMFFVRTERFERALKKFFVLEDSGPMLSEADEKKFGCAEAITDKVLNAEFPNAVIFGLDGRAVMSYVCFSPFEEELCYRGYKPRSPYEKD